MFPRKPRRLACKHTAISRLVCKHTATSKPINDPKTWSRRLCIHIQQTLKEISDCAYHPMCEVAKVTVLMVLLYTKALARAEAPSSPTLWTMMPGQHKAVIRIFVRSLFPHLHRHLCHIISYHRNLISWHCHTISDHYCIISYNCYIISAWVSISSTRYNHLLWLKSRWVRLELRGSAALSVTKSRCLRPVCFSSMYLPEIWVISIY